MVVCIYGWLLKENMRLSHPPVLNAEYYDCIFIMD